jgi:RNA polymerase sigma factor (sigma-70 family)
MPTAPLSLIPALRRVIAARGVADATDADLLTAFVTDRDAEAFAALVRRHGPMVLGVCRRVVHDPDAADDAFQATFLVLARRAGAVRPRNRVGAWLYGVAYRTALKARAVRARRRTRESQVDAMPEPAAPPAADGWAELKPILDEELARLPDRLRVPVVLCDLEGRPQRAVAGQLGIAPATLAGRLADARRTLAARLTRRGVALSAGALAALLGERASAAVVTPTLAAGVVKAAEVLAAGGAASGLVSANALQLCDGVMRMIFLSKLKAAAAAAVAVVVAVGVGPGLVTARAGDGPKAVAGAAAVGPRAGSDDAAFLDQICLAARGFKGTEVEHAYFAADADAAKRRKVMNWLGEGADAAARPGDGPATGATVLTDVFAPRPGPAPFVYEVFNPTTGKHPPAAGVLMVGDGVAAVNAGATVKADDAMLGALTRRVRLAADADKKAPAAGAEVGLFGTADGKPVAVQVVVDTQPPAVVKKAVVTPAAPAAGQPVRLKVVTAEDDGKGGVRYKVVVDQTDAAKKAEPGKQAEKKVERVEVTGKKVEVKGTPGTLYYELVIPGGGKKVEGLKAGTVRGWESPQAGAFRLWAATPQPGGVQAEGGRKTVVWGATAEGTDTDAAFLRRAVTEARGTPPTAIEERYFAADTDPRKREKLLDAILSDPAAARRVGQAWKQRMLAPARPQPQVVPFTPDGAKGVFDLHNNLDGTKGAFQLFRYPNPPVQPTGKVEVVPYPAAKDYVVPKGKVEFAFPRNNDFFAPKTPSAPKAPTPPAPPSPPKAIPPAATVPGVVAPRVAVIPAVPATPAPPVRALAVRGADRWSPLVRELIGAGKSDEQILEALTLATASRLPTDVEKRLALAIVPTAGDRAAGWVAVARALAGSTPPTPPAAPLPKSKQ